MREVEQNVVSSCCGASVYAETDVCCECKEHCSIIDNLEWLQDDWMPEKVVHFTNRKDK